MKHLIIWVIFSWLEHYELEDYYEGDFSFFL